MQRESVWSTKKYSYQNNNCEVTGKGVVVHPDHDLIKTSTDKKWLTDRGCLYSALTHFWESIMILQAVETAVVRDLVCGEWLSWKKCFHYKEESNVHTCINNIHTHSLPSFSTSHPHMPSSHLPPFHPHSMSVEL